jgi:membrane associated rhomboid family serine protease
MQRGREPILNLPRTVSGLLAALILIEVVRAFLPFGQNAWIVATFAFIPARYTAEGLAELPGGIGAAVWTPFTYAFLHGGWEHLAVNGIWLAAFGSALAWRFGPARFLAFSGLCAAAGAGAHLVFYGLDSIQPVVGASAAISGHMAAVCRFAFERGGPLSFGSRSPERFRAPARPLAQALSQSRVLVFLGVWFGLNLLFGAVVSLGGGEPVAWQAHIGGFLAGLLAFPLFDPIRPFGAVPH